MSRWYIERNSGGPTQTVAVGESLELHEEWMGDCYVTVTVHSAEPIDFQLDDFIYYRDEIFSIIDDPNIIKKAKKGSYGEGFTYENIKFYSAAARTKYIAFNDYVLPDPNAPANKIPYSSMSTFSFFAASVEDLADRIQANLDRMEPDIWHVYTPMKARSLQRGISASDWAEYYDGEGLTTTGKTDIAVTADNLSCWDALKLSYTAFDASYHVDGHNIIIGATAIAADHDFRYGKGLGLYEIERATDENQTVITKLYAYGSERNIPYGYYANLHKKAWLSGKKFQWSIIAGETLYSILTSIPRERVGFTDIREVTVTINNVQTKATLDFRYGVKNLQPDGTGWEIDYDDDTQYLRLNLNFGVENPNAQALFEAYVNDSQIVIDSGVSINTWPSDHIITPQTYNYDAALSVNKLMLPGFPDTSLYDWVLAHGGAHLESMDEGQVVWGKWSFYASKDKQDPWIMSTKHKTEGMREGTATFDESSGHEICPTIEGTGLDIVAEAQQIDDNGYLGDDPKDSQRLFTMRPATIQSYEIDWTDTDGEEVTISMKDGACVGREFKMQKAQRNEDKQWVLTLERYQDSSIGRYFPYKAATNTNLYQVSAGNHFVALGIKLPDAYVELAAKKLLEAALDHLLEVDHHRHTYVPKVNEIYMKRQDDAVKAEKDAETYGTVSLHDTLHAGMMLQMNDTDLKLRNYTPFIDVLTIKEDGNNGIPTYDIVLREEKELTLQDRIQSQIEGGVNAMVNVSGGKGVSAADIMSAISGKFLSKTEEDETEFLIRFLGGLIVDKMAKSPEFKEGVWSPEGENDGRGFGIWKSSGKWYIETDYATVREILRTKEAIAKTLSVSESAEIGSGVIEEGGRILPSLKVNGHSEFTHDLYSSDFISAFIGGQGWSIQRKERTNVGGVTETYYELEIDNITVRNLLRVYEFVVSQLRGENDNYMFAAFLKVHHYDPDFVNPNTHIQEPAVWLQTEQGKFYNPFRKDDCIVVQQYCGENDAASGGDGYITKHYELVITDAGMGGETDVDENGDRLDWVTFKNFTTTMEGGSPLGLIKKDDTFVRQDNLSDPERKGVIQIMTVGPNTPYMDVDYGLVTDPNNALKSRIGKLEGLVTPHFGKLEGFGAYINNLYSVGRMLNHQTGERYVSDFVVTNENFKSVYNESTYDTSGNFLYNGEFQFGIDKWSYDSIYGNKNPQANEDTPVGDKDGSIYINGELLASQKTSKIEESTCDGVRVIRLNGHAIRQSWTDMVDDNGTHEELKYPDAQMPTEEDYQKELPQYYQDPNDITKKKINPSTGKEYTDSEINTAIAAAKVANKAKYDMATETEEIPDTLYLAVRMKPVTQGNLKVSIVNENGVSREILYEYQVPQNIDYKNFTTNDTPNNPWVWDITKNGYIKVEYTGECLLRFVTIQNNPIDDLSVTFQTLFSQNARRILLEARRTDSDRTMMSGMTIQYNAIVSRVTTNEVADKTYIYDLLGITINDNGTYTFPEGWEPDPSGNYDFSSWRIQTSGRIDDIVSKWDDEGHLIGYSTTTQTAEMISTEVVKVDKKIIDVSDLGKWEQGSFTSIGGKKYDDEGVKTASSNYIRYADIIPVTKDTTFTLNEGYKLKYIFFNGDKVIPSSGLSGGEKVPVNNKLSLDIPDGVYYVAIAICKNPASAITKSEVAKTGISVIDGKMASTSYVVQTADSIMQSVEDISWQTTRLYESQWEQGTVLASPSAKPYGEIKTTSTSYIRLTNTIGIVASTETPYLTLETSNTVKAVYFGLDGNYISQSGYVSPTNKKITLNVPSNARTVAFVINTGNVSNLSSIKLKLLIPITEAGSYIIQTANSINQTVTSNKAAADTAFSNINTTITNTINPNIKKAQDAADAAQSAAEDAQGGVDTINATDIMQDKDRIAALAANFNEDGSVNSASGIVIEDNFAKLFATEADDTGVAHTSDLTVYVQKDANNNIVSGIKMSADQLNFNAKDIIWNLGKKWTVLNKNNDTILYLDANGNLSIGGQLTATQTNLNITNANIGSLMVFDNASQLKWKSNATTGSKVLTMLTLDGNNQFVVGEGLTSAQTSGDYARSNDSNYRLYLRGTKIIFQTGYGSSESTAYGEKATLTSDGVLEIQTLKIGDIYIGKDSTNDALKVYKISNNAEVAGNLYTKGWLSAFGVGSTSGGGSIELTSIVKHINDNPQPNWSSSTNGLLSITSGIWSTTPVSQFVQTGGTQTITGAKTFTKDVTIQKASASLKVENDSGKVIGINNGNRRGVYDWTISDFLLGTDSNNSKFLSVNYATIGNLSISESAVGTISCVALETANSRGIYLKGANGLPVYGSGAYTNVSDIRLKDVIGNIVLDIKSVADAPIFDYRMKADKDGNVSVGSSAQYWQKTLPNAVKETPDGYLSLDYAGTALASAITTARKVVEQEQEIKTLRNEVAELKELVRQLMAKAG